MRSLELDPLINSNDLLVPISLNGDGSSKEQEGEGWDHGRVMEEYRRALDFGVVDDKFVVK